MLSKPGSIRGERNSVDVAGRRHKRLQMLVCGATSNMLEELSGLGSICEGERMVGVLRRYPASGLMPCQTCQRLEILKMWTLLTVTVEGDVRPGGLIGP